MRGQRSPITQQNETQFEHLAACIHHRHRPQESDSKLGVSDAAGAGGVPHPR